MSHSKHFNMQGFGGCLPGIDKFSYRFLLLFSIETWKASHKMPTCQSLTR